LDDLEQNVVDASKTKGGAGYAFPVLKAYRRHIWGDQLTHGGTITQVQIVSGVRQDLTKEQVGQLEVGQDGIRTAEFTDIEADK
jgi:hypothetical protein